MSRQLELPLGGQPEGSELTQTSTNLGNERGVATGCESTSLTPALQVAAQQVMAFDHNALPLLIELARFTKGVLKSELSHLPKQWCYEDRVLALLAPSLVADIRKYYQSGGPNLANMFERHQLAHMDRDLVVDLGVRLEHLQPGITAILGKLGPGGDEQD
jgi:hypothetical protein